MTNYLELFGQDIHLDQLQKNYFKILEFKKSISCIPFLNKEVIAAAVTHNEES